MQGGGDVPSQLVSHTLTKMENEAVTNRELLVDQRDWNVLLFGIIEDKEAENLQILKDGHDCAVGRVSCS